MSLAPGTRLGAYEILAPLGAGGMGEVYRARDTRLGREVAIKVIAAALSADPDRLKRFEQEARAAATLNHPNILAVHDVGAHNGAPFIVSELLEGETLRERLTSGLLPVRKAIDIGIHIAHALAAAHDKGIVHRDLKPENIFLTMDGRAKVLDFGLAKLTQTDAPFPTATNAPTSPAGNMTQAGAVLGTVGYMAPEQVRGQPVDHRADIFAFGALLYEMLGGRRAFAGATTADTISAILKDDPVDLPALERHIPPGLIRIVDRCLEKQSGARFQTAADLAFALDALSTSHSDRTAAMPALPRARADVRVPLMWMVAMAVVLLAGGALGLLYLRHAPGGRLVSKFEIVSPPSPDPLSFALSPDGRRLAYVAEAADGSRPLWLRSFEEATPVPLAGTDGASYPFFSHDSRSIGFFADAKLKRIDLAGGTVQELASAPVGRGGTWSQDNVILFAPNTVGGLRRVSGNGGTTVAVTNPAAAENSHRWPQFLPDGRHFLFGVALGRLDTRGTYVASLDGREPTRLLADDIVALYASDALLVTRQGTVMALKFDPKTLTASGQPMPVSQNVGQDAILAKAGFAVSTNGVMAQRAIVSQRRQFVWRDRKGNDLGPLAEPDDAGTASPALSPDGQRVAVARSVQRNIDIWMIEVARGALSRFTFHPANDTAPPVWSPDGRQVAFRSNRNGPYDLFVKPANQSADEQPLVVSTENKSAINWSADGRLLLYTSLSVKTGSDIWALPFYGDKKPFVVLQTPFDEMEPQFSPDGKWIAYVSNESGVLDVHIRAFPGPGGLVQVSRAGGRQLRWGIDGREVYFIARDGYLMAAPIAVTEDGQGIAAGEPVRLFAPRLASGSNVTLSSYTTAAQYLVNRDGRFIMNVAAEVENAPPISIVLNWDVVLQK